jgi:CHAT domain-containing protein
MEAARAGACHGARALDDLLVAPLMDRVRERPVVVVPSGPTHALQWAMLPHLRDLPVTVSPSAALWLDAEHRPPSQRRGTAVVIGPGLPAAPAEATSVLRAYSSDAVLLSADASTVAAAIAALATARCAHIAAHGHFRADNPLFSSLVLADGELTVHDLELAESVPEFVVLSSCDSGLSAVHPGEELMGLASSLLGMGTRCLIASVSPVPDDVACRVMGRLHEHVTRGTGPAEALVLARSAFGDGMAAASFICLGAG